MIVRDDKVICIDPLGNNVYFNGRSLGLTVLIPEIASQTSNLLRSAIEKPFIIVKGKGKLLYCSVRKNPEMNFFIAEVVLRESGWYVKKHCEEHDFEKLQDLFLRQTKIYCGTTNLPYDATPVVKEDLTDPKVLSFYRDREIEIEQKRNEEESYEAYEHENDYDEECSLIQQANNYTVAAIGDFLTEVIQHFSDYRLSYRDLPIIANMLKIVKDIENYTVKGYLYVLVKHYTGADSFRCNEIHLDEDGLKLTTGGYETGDYGGDSYSSVIFPLEDEEAAINMVDEIESFVGDFKEMLSHPETEIEVIDSGDGIEERD